MDERELAKFAEMASRWWDPSGEFGPLHDINPLRLSYVARRVPLSGAKVLDVGCGGGILSEALAAEGAEVTAIDAGEDTLAVARLHALESGCEVDYRRLTAEELAETESGAYDVVTCMELLEHVPDPVSLVKACARLLRPGGALFVSTINRNPKSYLFAILGAEYVLGLLPRGTHDYARFVRPSELGRWLRSAGLQLSDLTGLSYNPLTRRYHLGRDVGVNYLAFAIRPAP